MTWRLVKDVGETVGKRKRLLAQHVECLGERAALCKHWAQKHRAHGALHRAATSTVSTSTPPTTNSFLSALFSQVVNWFTLAGNGISDFNTSIEHAKQFCTQNSDATLTCVNGDHLK